MRARSTLIIDDFYDDPIIIRSLALSLKFRPKDNAMYPGAEAWTDLRDWEPVRQVIMTELGMGNRETPIPGKNFKQGKFRLAMKEHESSRPDAVHHDAQRYSAIVYLAPNQYCTGGIGIYQCKLSGQTVMNRIWLASLSERFDVAINDPAFPDLVHRYCADWSNWEQIGELPMRFNRLIILMARCFHASTGIFGTDPASGRLTQHFEIYL
ncbi:hypothetical protein FPJ27_14650 [Burkholderia sp. MS455]|uniref:DUF6445 family protein n=1 Tax=Burkholderia sp. MS455 TaxID=2811788 RepID=UPI00195B6640|nr:DUF6445 family protein [Burkholderia sp. MS455]QRR07542.1 hypothetical protein FPJ27_14650 [Burkholderia sp. MS455]